MSAKLGAIYLQESPDSGSAFLEGWVLDTGKLMLHMSELMELTPADRRALAAFLLEGLEP